MSAPRPNIQVLYDNVDISADISKNLVSFTYKDKVTGETDELELQIEDVDGLWAREWYPKKGAKLVAKMGYDSNLVDCGTFQIDEIELSGPPATIHIRALGTFISAKMRTKKSKANENVTLKKLAEEVASNHSLTLDDGTKTVKLKRPDTTDEQKLISLLAAYARKQGNELDNATRYLSIAALQQQTFKVALSLEKKGYTEEANLLIADCKMVAANMTRENCFKFSKFANEIQIKLINTPLEYSRTTNLGLHKIKLERSTQYQENDLAYLRRIAEEYGFAYSIKGDVMVFYNIKALEESPAVQVVGLSALRSYTLKDKTADTYKSATVKSHNPDTNETVSFDVPTDEKTAENGDSYTEITKEDSLEIRTRAENKEQAEAKAKAALHKHNSKGQEGSISVFGNPLLMAGNNFELQGVGRLSGKFHITESTHTITKSGGYTTDLEIKRVSRFTADGSETKTPTTQGGKPKRGNTLPEENKLGVLAEFGSKVGAETNNAARYGEVSSLLQQTYPIIKSLFAKHCDKEAKDLQANCEALAANMSREQCFRFSKFCSQIRIELIRARK